MSPYRASAYPFTEGKVTQEMLEACKILYEWRKWHPVIAGGALWSWAALQPCNDIDIFIKSTWRTRRRANRIFGADDGNRFLATTKTYSDYWETKERPKWFKTRRYRSVIVATGTKLDFVLNPFKGARVIHYFDYAFCAVAFGPSSISSYGSTYFQDGDLEAQHCAPRDYQTMRVKTEKHPLWGKMQAGPSLVRTLQILEQIYAQVTNDANPHL